ncbi:uncharacterized protein TRIVIDRAFT_217406 [Trichoderma virens Gv29-8]|uniref:Uncharacterized protein n=1 Tax=Hypocrea virens (strain Gv29-8 / FGSC 10586) TaxID=413071 RepID=G9MFP5_HYPVG|nr:uncharacterized protein TRIVIDRAFT_217406 [Trichoderma virens Gv29-8]EHK26792.1 hypothetical protein TRIVIDRAFT_217406 [Trichoderma virens Gv29-8]UKZ57247.1 hypothetical protein TrVGV298_011100 [Trichoderma virens]
MAVNVSRLIMGYMTLIDIAEQRNFSIIVATSSSALEKHWSQELSGPFAYPYRDVHSWSIQQYEEQLPRSPSKKSFYSDYDQVPVSWAVKIMDNPRWRDAMAHHQMGEDDLILRVREPPQGQLHHRPDFNVHIFSNLRAANIAFDEDENIWNSISLEFDLRVKECKTTSTPVICFILALREILL